MLYYNNYHLHHPTPYIKNNKLITKGKNNLLFLLLFFYFCNPLCNYTISHTKPHQLYFPYFNMQWHISFFCLLYRILPVYHIFFSSLPFFSFITLITTKTLHI
eukprot:UN10821